MANLKKLVKRAAITFLGLLIGIPLLLVAINAFDEDLKPDAVVFADFSGDDVPAELNGFFAWAGLTVPIGEDPHARGMQIVMQVNEILDRRPREAANIDSFLGPEALKLTGNLMGLCGRDATGCLDRYRTKTSDIEKQVRENKLLLERYRALYRYPNFRETTKPRYFAPFFTVPASVSGLVRAQHALHALRGEPMEALRQLRDDTQFWRRVLTDSRSLVSKMVALAATHRNAQLTSEIVARYPTDKNYLALVMQAVRPLTDHERDLTKVFRYEFATNKHFLATLPTEGKVGCIAEFVSYCAVDMLSGTFLYKPNATLNQSFKRFSEIAAISRLPASQFRDNLEENRNNMKGYGEWLWFWHFVYNPVGKLLNSIVEPAYNGYIVRIHNLDGFLRLASLQLGIKQAAIPDTDIPEFLRSTPPELRNPYTGDPMSWDATNRTIFLYGMSDNYDEELLSKRIEVRL